MWLERSRRQLFATPMSIANNLKPVDRRWGHTSTHALHVPSPGLSKYISANNLPFRREVFCRGPRPKNKGGGFPGPQDHESAIEQT
jgi:hypothetical protein